MFVSHAAEIQHVHEADGVVQQASTVSSQTAPSTRVEQLRHHRTFTSTERPSHIHPCKIRQGHTIRTIRNIPVILTRGIATVTRTAHCTYTDSPSHHRQRSDSPSHHRQPSDSQSHHSQPRRPGMLRINYLKTRASMTADPLRPTTLLVRMREVPPKSGVQRRVDYKK